VTAPANIPNVTPQPSAGDVAKRRALLARIELLTGHAGPREPIGRVSRCGRCRRRTVRGLDGYLCATDIRLDPAPLSPLGEVYAIVSGRGSWSVTLRGMSRLELAPRYQWDIDGTPAGQLERGDVVTAHLCASPWPWSGPLSAPSRIIPPTWDAPAGGDPPF
jgi:hypothetical protein